MRGCLQDFRKHIFRELQRVTEKQIEKGAVRILRRRAAYISGQIQAVYAEDDDENMNKFRQQAPDKSVQLNKWLEKKFSEPYDEVGPECSSKSHL